MSPWFFCSFMKFRLITVLPPHPWCAGHVYAWLWWLLAPQFPDWWAGLIWRFLRWSYGQGDSLPRTVVFLLQWKQNNAPICFASCIVMWSKLFSNPKHQEGSRHPRWCPTMPHLGWKTGAVPSPSASQLPPFCWAVRLELKTVHKQDDLRCFFPTAGICWNCRCSKIVPVCKPSKLSSKTIGTEAVRQRKVPMCHQLSLRLLKWHRRKGTLFSPSLSLSPLFSSPASRTRC